MCDVNLVDVFGGCHFSTHGESKNVMAVTMAITYFAFKVRPTASATGCIAVIISANCSKLEH